MPHSGTFLALARRTVCRTEHSEVTLRVERTIRADRLAGQFLATHSQSGPVQETAASCHVQSEVGGIQA